MKIRRRRGVVCILGVASISRSGNASPLLHGNIRTLQKPHWHCSYMALRSECLGADGGEKEKEEERGKDKKVE